MWPDIGAIFLFEWKGFPKQTIVSAQLNRILIEWRVMGTNYVKYNICTIIYYHSINNDRPPSPPFPHSTSNHLPSINPFCVSNWLRPVTVALVFCVGAEVLCSVVGCWHTKNARPLLTIVVQSSSLTGFHYNINLPNSCWSCGKRISQQMATRPPIRTGGCFARKLVRHQQQPQQ